MFGINTSYAIMDNNWCTAEFVPYLTALDGDIEILGLVASRIVTCDVDRTLSR